MFVKTIIPDKGRTFRYFVYKTLILQRFRLRFWVGGGGGERARNCRVYFCGFVAFANQKACVFATCLGELLFQTLARPFDIKPIDTSQSAQDEDIAINLNGNNANQDGKYTFGDDHDLAGYTLVYDLKGNGSNIKDLMLILN